MIRLLRQLISVKNLIRKRANARGQVATFLLLMVVAVLIFAFMTANLGNLSLTATRMANAADSSALLLGSQLATKSRVLWESLGRTTQKCKKGGFLGLILAIVFAVVAIVVAPYVAPWLGVATGLLPGAIGTTVGAGAFVVTAGGGLALTAGGAIAVGALGGAIGGAIGGGITGGGQGALFGALQGALIGASIGWGMGTFGGGTPVAGPEGLVVGDMFGGTAALAPGEALPASWAGAIPAELALFQGGAQTALLAVSPGAMGGGALSAGSNLTSGVLMDMMRGDAIAAAAKALSGLPEYDRFRDSAIHEAFVQTVDDPTTVPDANDSDEDGDTTEKVPAFQVWWKDRLNGIKGTLPALTSLVQGFLSGPVTTFDAAAKAAYTTTTTTSLVCDMDGNCSWVTTITTGPLSRQEIEGADGAVVGFARALESAGFPISFWDPLPSAADLKTWQELECADCPAPAGFDEVDFAVEAFQDVVELASADRDVGDDGLLERPVETLVGTWQTWVKFFYDPDLANDDDFYDVLEALVNGGNGLKGMNAWKTEIETIRQGLPTCIPVYDWDFNWNFVIIGVANPPCQGDGAAIPVGGGSLDTDLEDEFTIVQGQLDTLIADIQTFRSASKQFYDDMQVASALPLLIGGINPVVYAWMDSRGAHSVTVQVGPFRIAYIKKKKSGGFLKKKICLILKDYSDNGTNAWVRITRQDPVTNTGFWQWNPHGGTITKISRVAYSFDSLGIAGIK